MGGDPYVVIGIDPAKTSLHGVSSGPEGFAVHTRTMPTEMTMCSQMAFRWMRRIVLEVQKDNPLAEVWVFIELPVVGRGGVYSTLVQAYINGALQAGAREGGAFMVHLVNNSSMKKKVCGNGKATKPQMAAHIKATWPMLYRAAKGNQNIIDSGIVTEYGIEFVKSQRRRNVRRKFRRG